MCALVLALRKVPIYAPGGGDSVLGSSDKPTYAGTGTNAQAAANREAFAKTKEGKRLVPTKKPDDTKSPTKDGASVQEIIDPKGPSVLRHRLSTLNEKNAINTLNTRHAAADTAQDPSDLMDSDIQTSGSGTPQDSHRNTDLDELRGLLNRQSTRGKRKTFVDANNAPMSEKELTPRMDVEYQSYPPQTLDPYLQQSMRFEGHSPPPQPLPQLPGPPLQMQQLPQIPGPVPGSGNAFAQQAREDRQHRQARSP